MNEKHFAAFCVTGAIIGGFLWDVMVLAMMP